MKYDNYQIKIIKSNEENIIVIAGAGTGKTTVIKGKIDYLINNNINPSKITVISYTNKAVNELRERINNEKVNICTIHSFAYQICKKEKDKITIITEKYLKKLIEIYLKTNKIKKIKTYFNNINYLKDLLYKLITLENPIKTKLNKRNQLLLKIKNDIEIIYNNNKQKHNLMDYNDLLINAIKILKRNNILKIKYLLVDEYQDLSDLKYTLIKLIKQNTNAKMLVVGDDAQSIYGFNGSNLENFYNFQKDFKNTKIYYLKKTYRYSQEIINITTKIIEKNKNQIKKQLISDKSLTNPIKIKYYISNKNKIKILENIIKNINTNNKILILGRYNFDIDFINKNKTFIKGKNNKIIYQKNKSYNITYLTIHSSKGLGFDEVIIINNEKAYYGFPSKIITDQIFINQKTKIIEEERRLFYVALTRTKNYNYLLTNIFKQSIFIKELKKIVKKMQN